MTRRELGAPLIPRKLCTLLTSAPCSTIRQHITSDPERSVGNVTRFFWRFARSGAAHGSESALYAHDEERRGDSDWRSLYVEERDLLALFAGDDDIVYAFRNGVFVAKRACNTLRFEKHFGMVEVADCSVLEIEHDLSNLCWDGVVCRHRDGDRYGNRLYCNRCGVEQAFDGDLPNAQYYNGYCSCG